jgi:putative FmdB family regulatory protein
MPIYEYHCHGCGKDFEELIRSALAEQGLCCQHCGSTEIKRAVSMFGFSTAGGSAKEAPAGRQSGHSCSGCHSHNCGHCH